LKLKKEVKTASWGGVFFFFWKKKPRAIDRGKEEGTSETTWVKNPFHDDEKGVLRLISKLAGDNLLTGQFREGVRTLRGGRKRVREMKRSGNRVRGGGENFGKSGKKKNKTLYETEVTTHQHSEN